MALAKSIAFKGTTLSYHKIGNLQSDYVSGKTTVGLLSYIDKAARDADPGNNMQGQYLDLDGVPPGNPTPADARAWAYDQIVAQSADWADATNA